MVSGVDRSVVLVREYRLASYVYNRSRLPTSSGIVEVMVGEKDEARAMERAAAEQPVQRTRANVSEGTRDDRIVIAGPGKNCGGSSIPSQAYCRNVAE